VQHSARDMFDLVADIEKYPEFLPLCKALVVRSHRQKQGRDILTADMTVAYKMLSETFTSRVVINRDELQIDVSYLDGPFEYLENRWRFADLHTRPDGTRHSDVQFSLDYKFKSRALGLVMGGMFDLAFSRFTSAFEKRADEVYGKSAGMNA